MRARFSTFALALSLVLGGFSGADPAPAPPPSPAALAPSSVLGGRWIARVRDNICGISDLKKVSNPARVSYDELLQATPQFEEMRRDRIDPQSTEGKALRNRAKTLVTKTCEVVRRSGGYCGVWKVIRHEDGRIAPDITDDVKARF